MKRFISLATAFLLLLSSGACGHPSEPPSAAECPNAVLQTAPAPPRDTDEPPSASGSGEEDNGMASIIISAGSSVFTAALYDNDTARAFLALLPMTLNMSELNGNEKYFYLPDSLPADARRAGGIQAGDLMLYGSDCLVLFYEGFTSSYSYTGIGSIEDASGLSDALGGGDVQVSFAAGG